MSTTVTNETVWVGDSSTKHQAGDLGFVVELKKHNTGTLRYELRGHPAGAPAGGEPMLYGTVKDSPYTRVTALGLGRVLEVRPNGRALVALVAGDAETRQGVNDLGYPELEREVDTKP